MHEGKNFGTHNNYVSPLDHVCNDKCIHNILNYSQQIGSRYSKSHAS